MSNQRMLLIGTDARATIGKRDDGYYFGLEDGLGFAAIATGMTKQQVQVLTAALNEMVEEDEVK